MDGFQSKKVESTIKVRGLLVHSYVEKWFATSRYLASQIHRLLVILCLILASIGCSDNQQQRSSPDSATKILRFTAIPDQNTTELSEKFAPLALYLSRELGIKVSYVPARDYQASVEMFRNGDVHLGWFGGLTGVQAREAVPGANAIAQGASDPSYFTYFIAHPSASLEANDHFPENINELRFTFGSESSTSGRLMPEFFIREHTGKEPMTLFTKPIGFSGSHDKTAVLVESGQYQLGAINYKVYEKRVAAGLTDPEFAKVVWRSPPYSDYNWTAHPALEEEFGKGFTSKLQLVLIGIEDRNMLSALPRDRLIPASNEEYDGIRQIAKQLGMIR